MTSWITWKNICILWNSRTTGPTDPSSTYGRLDNELIDTIGNKR